MFSEPAFDNHERVEFVFDEKSGLRAIIAIHSTKLGPAAGGCRLWNYDLPENALHDALRLSKGMSYKNALANLPFGGGKAVILGPVEREDRDSVFAAFGAAVKNLSGAYITAEDVGVSVRDMEQAARKTQFVSGLAAKNGGAGGDPSPFTARGVLRGIEAVVGHQFHRSDLEGLTVAVQGLGGVGGNLCRLLSEAGVSLIVADVDPKRVEQMCDETGARKASPDDIVFADADILAPCALGGVFTEDVVYKIRAKAIAGGANNQLANEAAGEALHERGILYAPDYVINAGGIITVAAEYLGENDSAGVAAKIDAIKERTMAIFERSASVGEPAFSIADKMAKERIDSAPLRNPEHLKSAPSGA